MKSWDDHRYFLAIARAGSLTGAAKALSVSQPTISRRLESIEQNLGARLFLRTRKGYELTASGAALFETVLRVEEELLEADRNLQGNDQQMSGTLRLTTTEMFINGYLGPHLWQFLHDNPEIELQLACTQSTLNLSRGDADLAIRFTESPHDTLVGRRVGTVAYGIYGATGETGARFLASGQEDWDWIGMHNETFNRMLFGTFLPNKRLKHRVDSMAAMHEMVREGLGVSILPCYSADRDPTLQRLQKAPLRDSKFDIWILYHPSSRRTQRLRKLAEFLAKRIKSDADLFDGKAGPHSPQQIPRAGE